jgi:hypothetical protein
MSDTESQALRRDFEGLRDEVRTWGGKIDMIHAAVTKMAGKVYVPGPPRRSLWAKLGSFLGMLP